MCCLCYQLHVTHQLQWHSQRAFLTPSATTFHQMLGSSGRIKKWRKHQRVGRKD